MIVNTVEHLCIIILEITREYSREYFLLTYRNVEAGVWTNLFITSNIEKTNTNFAHLSTEPLKQPPAFNAVGLYSHNFRNASCNCFAMRREANMEPMPQGYMDFWTTKDCESKGGAACLLFPSKTWLSLDAASCLLFNCCLSF